jgi:hypothetical protein
MMLPPIARFHYNVIGLFIGVLGIIGDMFESLVKRAGLAKDSGIFFPGLFALVFLLIRNKVMVVFSTGLTVSFLLRRHCTITPCLSSKDKFLSNYVPSGF